MPRWKSLVGVLSKTSFVSLSLFASQTPTVVKFESIIPIIVVNMCKLKLKLWVVSHLSRRQKLEVTRCRLHTNAFDGDAESSQFTFE